MNSNGTVLQTNALNFPTNTQNTEEAEVRVYEETEIQTVEVSEIKTENKGTRFARLKRVLRKRSSASIL